MHDNAYSEITYDGYRAPSFLETPGAMEVGIEIFSLSKTYNMTGWRAGAVVGNADLVGAYWQLKTNIDSGMFEAVQEASAAALRSDQSSVVGDVRDLPAPPRRAGRRASADRPAGATRRRARSTSGPACPTGETSASFTERVLEEAAVVISPGAAYGPSGEGFVRMSLTVPDERLNEAADRIAALVDWCRGERPSCRSSGCARRGGSPSAPTRATPASTWWPPRPATSPPGAPRRRADRHRGRGPARPRRPRACRARASPAGTG